ncbi:MAG: tetratricopeptide repeat protein, partial [Anaerolineales bacterium]|nr:tetratricopeptide repeat protein [Anaerolineales bacterium]
GSRSAETHILTSSPPRPSPPAPERRQVVHNLPPQPTPFIGREAELAALDELIANPDVRLITIVGPGGMGKTRLALAAAERQLTAERQLARPTDQQTKRLPDHPATRLTPFFPHGVYFVSLAPVSALEHIIPTIAEALDFRLEAGGRQTRSPQQQLFDYLRQKRLLLIMDNFEHLLNGAKILVDILHAAPNVQILATARERLHLQQEQVYPIQGLPFPEEETAETRPVPIDASEFAAVTLFLQSARRIQPGFELVAEEVEYLVRICQLVEGMPLGLELAASWVDVLSLADIAAQVQQSLDFLETEMRDVPARHRSMRAVFDTTWQRLSEVERRILSQLAVFCGGFTRQAAQEVTKTSIHGLRSFVNKSLLGRTIAGRYQIHELLRQYAAEKLNQDPAAYEAARDGHSAFYCTFLHQWEIELKSARRLTALEDIMTELQNVRAAWNWAVAHGQTERLEQALESLGNFYKWRGHYREGEVALRAATEKLSTWDTDEHQQLQIRLFIWQANFNRDLGQTEQAAQQVRRSLDMLDAPKLSNQDLRLERADALYCLGSVTLRHDYEEARRVWQKCYELYQAVGEQWGMAKVLGYLAMIAWELGQYDEAKQLIEENLAIEKALGNQIGIGDMFSTLGWIALAQGQLEQAEQLAQKCTTFYREIGDQSRIAKGLRDLAAPKIYLGKFTEADSLLEESAAMYNELGGSGDQVFTNILLGATKAHLGQYGQARSWEELGLKLAQKFEDRAGVGRTLVWLGRVALVEGAHAEAQRLLQESVAIFRELGQKDQLSAALASLGHSARGLGNLAEARQYLVEALQTATEIGAFLPLLFAIPLASLLAADREEKEQAVELYTLALGYAFVANSCWCDDAFGQHISNVAGTLPYDVVTAAQERGKTRDFWATAKELLAEIT